MRAGVRVMNVMAGARFGGAETFFARLAVAFHEAGQPQLVAIRCWPERAAELRAAGVEPPHVPFRGSLDLYSRWKPRDRKSVVEGKSVSVRVDLGGRRFIRKTKKRKTKS